MMLRLEEEETEQVEKERMEEEKREKERMAEENREKERVAEEKRKKDEENANDPPIGPKSAPFQMLMDEGANDQTIQLVQYTT